MGRLLDDKKMKTVIKGLVKHWQDENMNDKLGTNFATDLLCSAQVERAIRTLFEPNSEDAKALDENYEEWIEQIIKEMFEERKARESNHR